MYQLAKKKALSSLSAKRMPKEIIELTHHPVLGYRIKFIPSSSFTFLKNSQYVQY